MSLFLYEIVKDVIITSHLYFPILLRLNVQFVRIDIAYGHFFIRRKRELQPLRILFPFITGYGTYKFIQYGIVD